MTVWGVDVSANNDPVDWAEYRKHGLALGFIKSNMRDGLDTKLAIHYDAARPVVPVLGLYDWPDPTANFDAQSDRFVKTLVDFPVELAAVDYEQWWLDWTKWYAAIRGEIPMTSVPKCDPVVLSKFMEDSTNNIVNQLPARVKHVMAYTNLSFIRSYAPSMSEWIGRYPAWYAWYPSNAKLIFNTWTEFDNFLAAFSKSAIDPMFGEFKIRQVYSNAVLPGRTTPLDINIWWGTEAELLEWAGVTQTVPPTEPPLTDYVTREEFQSELSIRDATVFDLERRVREVLAQLAGDDAQVAGVLNNHNTRIANIEVLVDAIKAILKE